MSPADPRDAAVATVVGAVLVAAIAVAGLILYRTTFVPVEEEKAEHRFAAAVAERLLEVRTDLDDHLARSGSGALTTPVPVDQGPSGPLAPPRPPNTIAFDDDEQTVTVHAPTARFAELNGTSVVQTEATWVAFTATDTVVRDITEVRDLWVKLDEVGPDRDGDAARVRVVDRDGFAGQFRVVVLRPGPPGQDFYEVRVQVQNAREARSSTSPSWPPRYPSRTTGSAPPSPASPSSRCSPPQSPRCVWSSPRTRSTPLAA